MKFLKNTIIAIGYFFLAIILYPPLEEIYRQNGSYPFVLGLILFSLIMRYKRIFLTKINLPFAIALLAVFALPPIFSELRLTLPGNIPWTMTPSTTAQVVNNAKVCVNDHLNGGDKCSFQIGPDLQIIIWAVGTPIATTTVNASAPPEKSYYSINFSAHDPCIRISTGEKITKRISDDSMIDYLDKRLAWISPFSAKAFETYYGCIEEIHRSLDEFKVKEAEEASFESDEFYDSI